MVTTFQLQEPAPRVLLASAVALLVHYCDISEGDAWTEVLNLAGYTPPTWIRIAVIEALYQGRYKVISVKQILDLWRRRGKILTHFNHEFEAIVTVPLPDRVQHQLRELAREHQQASRQQRHLQAVPVRSGPSSRPIPPLVTVQRQSDPQNHPSPNDLPLDEAARGEEAIEKMSTPHPAFKIAVDRPSSETETSSPEAIVPDSPNARPIDAPLPDVSVPDAMGSDLIPTDAALESPAPSPLPLQSVVLKASPRLRGNPKRIDQFCPLADPSEFDRKLLALANQT